jgi:hypothetical protein
VKLRRQWKENAQSEYVWSISSPDAVPPTLTRIPGDYREIFTGDGKTRILLSVYGFETSFLVCHWWRISIYNQSSGERVDGEGREGGVWRCNGLPASRSTIVQGVNGGGKLCPPDILA